MCLIINPRIHPTFQPHISDKPIHVMKSLTIYRGSFGAALRYKSPFWDYEYYEGLITPYVALMPVTEMVQESTKEGMLIRETLVVQQGYHAYYNVYGCWSDTYQSKTALCVIPANTPYFVGMNRDIVASQLQVLSIKDINQHVLERTDFLFNYQTGHHSFQSKEIKEIYADVSLY